MTLTDTKITRYADGKFTVDIMEKPDKYEAWLAHEDYGISELMFGVPKTETDYDTFLACVEVALEEYEESYADDYLWK